MNIGLLNKKISLSKQISGISLIAGTTIGAGMLGMPLVTAESGFFPAVCITFFVWGFMMLTGLLYVEVALALPPGGNILSMAGMFLGKKGKGLAGGMFLFLYYSLLVAYFAGGAPLLGMVFKQMGLELSSGTHALLFGLIFGGIVWKGARAIDRVNLILMVGLLVSYFLVMSVGSSQVNSSLLSVAVWPKALFALPVLFSAFGFHNIVPSLCTYLERDRKTLLSSVVGGTALALVIYVAWQWLTLGSLSQERIKEALLAGEPITMALGAQTGRSSLFLIGQSFGFFALVTSFLGVAFSMVDFLSDGMKMGKKSRSLMVALTLIPPACAAALFPAIFEMALGIAGGFGEAFLNGLLPVLMVWKCRQIHGKEQALMPGGTPLLGGLLISSLFVMGLEIFLLVT